MTLAPLEVATYVSNVFPILALTPALRRPNRAMHVLFVFFLLSALIDAVTTIMAKHRIHNLGVLDCHHLAEFFLLSFFFHLLEADPRARRNIRITGTLFFLLWVVAKATVEPFNGHSSYSHALASGIVSIYAVRLLVTLMTRDDSGPWFDERFVGGATILFYYTGNLFLFGSLHMLIGMNPRDSIQIWQYHWVLSIVSNILFSAGMVWTSRT